MSSASYDSHYVNLQNGFVFQTEGIQCLHSIYVPGQHFCNDCGSIIGFDVYDLMCIPSSQESPTIQFYYNYISELSSSFVHVCMHMHMHGL